MKNFTTAANTVLTTLTSVLAIACMTILFLPTTADGQERQMFGGVGIPNFAPPAEPEPPRFSLPNLFSRNDGTGMAKPATPAINWPKLNPFNTPMGGRGLSSGNGLLGGLIPGPDPNRPRLLEEWNQRSKDFFSRTSDGITEWTRSRSDNFRSKSAEAWGNLTRGLTPGGMKNNSPMPGAQPQMRSAELPGQGGLRRF